MNKDSLATVAKETPLLATEKEEILNDVKPENVKEDVVDKVNEVSTYFERIIAMGIEAIPSIIKAALILIIGLFFIRIVLKIVRSRFEKRNVDLSLRGFLMSIIKFVLYAL